MISLARRLLILCAILASSAAILVAAEFALGSDLGVLIGIPTFALINAVAISYALDQPEPALAATLTAIVTGLALVPNIQVLEANYDHQPSLFRYFSNAYWGFILPAGILFAAVSAAVVSLIRRHRLKHS